MEHNCEIGNMVCIGSTGRTFHGPIVATPDALYLNVMRDSAHEQLDTDMRGVAGVMERVGGLVQLAPIAGLDQFEVSTLEVRGAFEFDDDICPVPPDAQRAFVFQRGDISSLRFSWMSGFVFTAAGIRIVAYGTRAHVRTADAFFTQHGWDVDRRTFWQRLTGQAA